jgi:phosphodiesterase/alkaline phosphatase D-like protein
MALEPKAIACAGVLGALAMSACSLAPVTGKEPAVYVQSGDISAHDAVVWARCNDERDGRIILDLATSLDFVDGRIGKPLTRVSAETDYTGAVSFAGLDPDRIYYYRARCEENPSMAPGIQKLSRVRRFKTAPDTHQAAAVNFVWMADVGRQGRGRNPGLAITDVEGESNHGGYVIFDVIRKVD